MARESYFARAFVEVVLLLILAQRIHGYNLALSDETAKYITSPVMEQLGEKTASGQSLPNDVKPSYFGYSLSLFPGSTGNTASMTVGSPKTIDPSDPSQQDVTLKAVTAPKGNVLTYDIKRDFGGPSLVQNYSAVPPPGPIAGDNFGISVPVRPDGNLMTCSPTREQDCGNLKYNPGMCFKSSDFGEAWARDARTKNLSCPTVDVELLFVLDGSGSVGTTNFETVKEWVKTITHKLNIDAGNVTVGVVQYSHYHKEKSLRDQKYIKTEIRIGQFVTYATFANKVDKLELQGYTTYTGHALKKVKLDFKATEGFDKFTTKQVMILLTDGKATDPDIVPTSAQNLRNIGVIPYAVGVGAVNHTELNLIANGNPKDSTRVFTVGNFGALDAIARELQTEIQNIALEGGDFEMQFGEVGLAAAYSKKAPKRIRRAVSTDFGNGGLYLGAVGAYDWSGCVIKYDSVDDETADIPTYADVQKVLPNRTKESYMGYSVITGFFEGGSVEYVATGAPRYNLMGAVVVYKPVRDSADFQGAITLLGHPDKRQLGAYFGGSVLTVDVNQDEKDDLLVGAPLYVGDHHDEGRVFVYISQPSSTLNAWKSETFEPLELDGGKLEGGRFGTSMADAGDLNKDGYNDVIIGAPLTEGDRGAVFVYHGGRNGMDTAAKQKILASELTGVSLKYFGQAVQGGVDLDGNKYPDIAVGAPKSDTVVIFRSRPVVKIEAEIKYNTTAGTASIDIFECIDKDYANCTELTVCFTATGASIEQRIGLHYNLTLDTEKSAADKRLEFRSQPGSLTAAVTTLSKEVYIKKNKRTCFKEGVHMKTTVGDYDSNVKSEVKYDLLAAHVAQPLSSVRDPNEANAKDATLNFAKSCGGDGCDYDLKLDADMKLPPYILIVNGERKDLNEDRNTLVVDSATVPIRVTVNLTNDGENAFDTKVAIVYTSQISFGAVSNKKSSTPTNSCVVVDTSTDLGNGLKKEVLRYNYRTNIMRPNAWCYFEFNLVTKKLRNYGNLSSFLVNVTAYTSDSSDSSVEKNAADNTVERRPSIIYRSDFTLTKKSVDIEIQFNETKEDENITSVTEIGRNTSDVSMDFEIKGDGYSNIPMTQVTLTWPSTTSTGNPLLYLYKVDCNANSGNTKTRCTCDRSKINQYGLLTGEMSMVNNTNASSIMVVPSTTPLTGNTSDCFNEKSGQNHTCETILCNVTNLGASEKVEFSAKFRLWTANILFNGSDASKLEFRSRFEVSTALSPLIINKEAGNVTVKKEQIITTSKPYKAPVPIIDNNNLWIYILAAIGGLLLLIAIIVILWKVGFFKSKYADMKKDAEDDLADETDFQGNGNGSTADMMEE